MTQLTSKSRLRQEGTLSSLKSMMAIKRVQPFVIKSLARKLESEPLFILTVLRELAEFCDEAAAREFCSVGFLMGVGKLKRARLNVEVVVD